MFLPKLISGVKNAERFYREGTLMEKQPSGEILLYEAMDGAVCVDVRLERETVWLSQEQIE